MSTDLARRQFLSASGTALASGAVLWSGAKDPSLKASPTGTPKLVLGIASYTFRSFKLEDTIAMTKRLGLTRITYKDMHLPLNGTLSQIQAAISATRNAGIEPYGCGVVYMRSEQEVTQAFQYAKMAGMTMIVGVPNHNLLELVDQKVKEFDIRVAVHNHGPSDKVFPSPQSAYEKIRSLDKRIGLCIDIGHTARLGIDPSEAAAQFADRLIDIHIKDVSSFTADGNTVEIGRGVIDIPKFLKTLIRVKYPGNVTLEYEKDEKDPLAGAAESIGYLRGVLAAL